MRSLFRFVLVAWVLGSLASCGGGQGGCDPPCGGGQVCCDFQSGKRCVDRDRC